MRDGPTTGLRTSSIPRTQPISGRPSGGKGRKEHDVDILKIEDNNPLDVIAAGLNANRVAPRRRTSPNEQATSVTTTA